MAVTGKVNKVRID